MPARGCLALISAIFISLFSFYSQADISCRAMFEKRYLDKLSAQKEIEEYQARVAALDDLDPVRVRSDIKGKAISKVVKEAEDLLTSLNITYAKDPTNSRVLLINPYDKGGHPFNQMSKAMFRKWGIIIEVNPLLLFEDQAGAMYDSDRSRLTLSNEEVALTGLNDYGAHEIRHAYNFKKAYNENIDHIFIGHIASHQSVARFHPSYPHLFSVDELTTYPVQLITRLRKTVRAEKANDKKFLDEEGPADLDVSRVGQILSNHTMKQTHFALKAISLLRRSPKGWQIEYKREEIDGVMSDMVYVTNARDNSFFRIFDEAINEKDPSSKKWTRVAYSQNGYEIQAYVLENLDLKRIPDQVPELIWHAERKWKQLNVVASRVNKAFAKAEKHIKAKKTAAALKDIQEIRDVVTLTDVK